MILNHNFCIKVTVSALVHSYFVQTKNVPIGVYEIEIHSLSQNAHSSSESNFLTNVSGGNQLYKKDNQNQYVQSDVFNEKSFYLAKLLIGSPPQEVGVLIDTGSSDLWVMSEDNPYCTPPTAFNSSDDIQGALDSVHMIDIANLIGLNLTKAEFLPYQKHYVPTGIKNRKISDDISPDELFNCQQYGTINEDLSDTFNSNGTSFSISYVDTTFAKGTWGYDSVKIGNVEIENLSFAVASKTNSTMGVLGIGLAGGESTLFDSIGSITYQYENFPMKMKSQGLINRNMYSLYVPGKESKVGSILFGGIDHAKYKGSLTPIPITPTQDGFYNHLQIPLTSMVIRNTIEQTTHLELDIHPALIDSGTTLSYFPGNVFHSIGKALNGSYDDSIKAYIIDTPSENEDKFITFTFGEGAGYVKASLHDFAIPIKTFSALKNNAQSDGTMQYVSPVVSEKSVLSIMKSDDETVTLGDNFLKNAYVVFDLDELTISVANIVRTGDSNIEVLTASEMQRSYKFLPNSGHNNTYSQILGALSKKSEADSSKLNGKFYKFYFSIISCVIVIFISA